MKGKSDSTGVDENSGFKLIPEGDYQCQIISIEDTKTKNGDPMISIQLEIKTGEFEGRILFDRIVIPDIGSPSFAIMGRTKHFLHCIDEDYEGQFDWDSENWKGKICKVNVGTKEYQGKTYNTVKYYILKEDESEDSAEDFPLHSEDEKILKEADKHFAKAAAKTASKTPQKDDEIPF